MLKRDDANDAEESVGCLQRERGHFCFEFLHQKESEACVSMTGKAEGATCTCLVRSSSSPF